MSRQGKLAALASTGVTKAELDLLDGVTSTTAELNITDGVTSTAAELNILDGVTATAAEINLIDGGTARGTTAVADGDGFLTNDGGTMRMTKVDTLATYMGTKIGGGMEFIASSGAISNGTSSVAFTGFDASKYDSYKFFFLYVVPVNDNVSFHSRVSVNGGGAYDSTSNNYYTTQGYDHIAFTNAIGGASGETTGASGTFTAFNPAYTGGYRLFFFEMVTETTGAQYDNVDDVVAYRGNEGTAVNAIQFFMSSGNIESGEITMFGVVNS